MAESGGGGGGGGGTVSARSLECEVVHTASGRRVPLQRRNQLWQSLGGTVSAARSLECEVVHTASGRRMALQWRNQFWQSLAEGAGNRAFQCLGFLTCALMLMHTCDCTRGLYGHSKSICIGRWLWEKNPLPHRGLSRTRVSNEPGFSVRAISASWWLFSEERKALAKTKNTYLS